MAFFFRNLLAVVMIDLLLKKGAVKVLIFKKIKRNQNALGVVKIYRFIVLFFFSARFGKT